MEQYINTFNVLIILWRTVGIGIYSVVFGIGGFYWAISYGKRNPPTEDTIRPPLVKAKIFMLNILGLMFLGCGVYIICRGLLGLP